MKEAIVNFTKEELAQIGSKIGADVPFFVYDFDSANVSGFGEVVKEYPEEAMDLEIFTPPVECDTKDVYMKYRELNRDKSPDKESFDWESRDSRDILRDIKEPTRLNDLLSPALELYPSLKGYLKSDYYFSGSGSSLFRVLNL